MQQHLQAKGLAMRKDRLRTGVLTIAGVVMVLSVHGVAAGQVELTSVRTSSPPTIDGTVAADEWDQAGCTTFSRGTLMALHDDAHLYFLVDLTEDTTDDPSQATPPWGDFFWLSFDVGNDAAVTANVDVNYGMAAGTHNLGIQYYTAAATWTSLYAATSHLGVGFGTSLNSDVNHRVWEFGIDRAEIGADASLLATAGLRVYSVQPAFDELLPTDFTSDFSDLIQIHLGLDCNTNGVEDNQDIAGATSQDCDNNGIPDECDADGDGDGVVDACDNCPGDANADQADADGDGVGDVCEPEAGPEPVSDPNSSGPGSSDPSPSDPSSGPTGTQPMCGCGAVSMMLFALLGLFYVSCVRGARKGG